MRAQFNPRAQVLRIGEFLRDTERHVECSIRLLHKHTSLHATRQRLRSAKVLHKVRTHRGEQIWNDVREYTRLYGQTACRLRRVECRAEIAVPDLMVLKNRMRRV